MNLSRKKEISENIYSQFISNDDEISKGNQSNLHYEWRDVTRNGKTFKQRYRLRNKEPDTSIIKENKKPFGGDSAKSAGFKDRLVYSHYYNGVLYDSKGERINLPDEMKDSVLAEFQKVYHKGIPIDKKESFLKVLPLIEEKDKHFNKEIERRRKAAEKMNDPNSKIDFVYRELLKIDQNTTGRELVSTITSIESVFNENLDPVVSIKRKDKESSLPLSEIKEALQQQINSGRGSIKLDIESFDIQNLSDFDVEDFRQVQPNLDYSDIYKVVNKKIENEKN